MDWDAFELDRLAEVVRETRSAPDAERTIWAFEEVLRAARIDPELLEYVLVAAVCLLARKFDVAPRRVLFAFLRRSVDEDEWNAHYRPLFA